MVFALMAVGLSERGRWWRAGGIAAGMAGVSFLIFEWLVPRSLPEPWFFRLLG
jgi:drug/metabolite transporter (DMT)-like permease